jgi:hypothetical protein
MQGEINATNPTHPVQILGVNPVGQEADNDLMCQGRTIPWLQETAEHPVWTPWAVTWRDVVILDTRNVRFSVYNLTPHDLADSTNYAFLKRLILEAANR